MDEIEGKSEIIDQGKYRRRGSEHYKNNMPTIELNEDSSHSHFA